MANIQAATLVKEACASAPGTGNYVTTSTVISGYRRFADVYSAGALVPYAAADTLGNYEWGVGTISGIAASAATIARTTILGSNNAGAAVNWTVAPTLMVSPLAEMQPFALSNGAPSTIEPGASWYDTASGMYMIALPGWETSGSLGTARASLAGAGSRSAGLAFGGSVSNAGTGTTETFSGSAWSSSGAMSTSVAEHAGCGTQSAALSVGGYTTSSAVMTTAVQAFNGSTWSAAAANIATATRLLTACGTQTAALEFLGYAGVGVNVTRSFNGTTWSTGGAAITARYYAAGCGTASAAMSVGGFTGVTAANTESYNGSAWGAGSAYPVATRAHGLSGTQTNMLGAAGLVAAVTTNCYQFSGAAWSTMGVCNTALQVMGYSSYSATSQNAWLAGGSTGAVSAVTQLYNTAAATPFSKTLSYT